MEVRGTTVQGLGFRAVDGKEIRQYLILRTLNYGNYGIFLTMSLWVMQVLYHQP